MVIFSSFFREVKQKKSHSNGVIIRWQGLASIWYISADFSSLLNELVKNIQFASDNPVCEAQINAVYTISQEAITER